MIEKPTLQPPTEEEQQAFWDLFSSDDTEDEILQKFDRLPQHIQAWAGQTIEASFLRRSEEQ